MGRKIVFIILELLCVCLLFYVNEYLLMPYVIFVLLSINIFLGIFVPKYFLIGYVFFLLVLLLVRENASVGVYRTKQWMLMIFTNKTVFINVFGNIMIFIPLGYALKNQVVCGILFSIIVELLQRIFDKGVFDYLDIVLNIMGTLIGFIIWELRVWMIKRKKRKKLMNSLTN